MFEVYDTVATFIKHGPIISVIIISKASKGSRAAMVQMQLEVPKEVLLTTGLCQVSQRPSASSARTYNKPWLKLLIYSLVAG